MLMASSGLFRTLGRFDLTKLFRVSVHTLFTRQITALAEKNTLMDEVSSGASIASAAHLTEDSEAWLKIMTAQVAGGGLFGTTFLGVLIYKTVNSEKLTPEESEIAARLAELISEGKIIPVAEKPAAHE